MRPDEHKRKRSQQYKKKHAIEEQTKSKDKNKQNSKPSKNDVGQKHKPITTSLVEGNKAGDNAEVTNHQLVYRRRKIESNWQRYEDDSEDVESIATSRGESFQKLLSSTGEALAQFQFEEEKDWASDVDAFSDFFKIDCHKLSARLKCVPLHKRLQLPFEVLDEKTISKFNCDAEENRIKYADLVKCKSRTDVSVTSDCKVSMHDDLAGIHNIDIDLDQILNPCTIGGATESVLKDNRVVIDHTIKESTRCVSEEKCLDFLLKLDNYMDEEYLGSERAITVDINKGTIDKNSLGLRVEAAEVMKSNSIDKHQELGTGFTEDSPEDVLDFLLSLDAPVKQGQATIQTSSKSKLVENDDSLEYWLDEILR